MEENIVSVNEPVLAQEIISEGLTQPSPLLFMLHRLQDEVGYVSEETVYHLSEALKVPMPEIISIVTFHRQFKFKLTNEPEPVARNIIRVCSGAPCYSKGSSPITEELCKLLEIDKGEATEDKKFFLEEVDCMGACAMSPVMMINEDIYGELETDQVPAFLEKYE